MDLTDTIVPRSDQLNAEDLLSGPRTVTITEVHKGASPEQPVDIVLDEFGKGRPFKPSKTVRRILVMAWGPEASAYTGRRMTLYRDPAVRFGGSEVGGIRVSHLSDIDKPLKLALTETRGKRAQHVIQPLAAVRAPKVTTDKPDVPDGITAAQLKELADRLRDHDLTERADMLAYVTRVIGRDITSSKELSKSEASRVIDSLDVPPAPETEPTLDGLS